MDERNSVIAVLATTLLGGDNYAKEIGLTDYQVYRNEDYQKLYGLRIKAIVVTPGYFEVYANAMLPDEKSNAEKALIVALQSASLTSSPLG